MNFIELLFLLMLLGLKLGLASKWLFVICMIPIFSGGANESCMVHSLCSVVLGHRFHQNEWCLFEGGCVVSVQQPGKIKETWI